MLFDLRVLNDFTPKIWPFFRDSIVISYFLFSSSRTAVLTGFRSTLEMFLTFCKLKEFLIIVRVIKIQFISDLRSFLKENLYCCMSNLRLQSHCKIFKALETKPFRNYSNSKHLHIKIPIFSSNSRTSCTENENNALLLRSRDNIWASPAEVKLLIQTLKNLHILNFEHITVQQDTQGSFESHWLQQDSLRVHINDMN